MGDKEKDHHDFRKKPGEEVNRRGFTWVRGQGDVGQRVDGQKRACLGKRGRD